MKNDGRKKKFPIYSIMDQLNNMNSFLRGKLTSRRKFSNFKAASKMFSEWI